ncbi:hypothetical protein C8J57DRAFT_1306852 [Mycena rebaudengoi]|nr:hypothetical protein C8J57DRAFT_1306852 [Mycena rebaudengoi]
MRRRFADSGRLGSLAHTRIPSTLCLGALLHRQRRPLQHRVRARELLQRPVDPSSRHGRARWRCCAGRIPSALSAVLPLRPRRKPAASAMRATSTPLTRIWQRGVARRRLLLVPLRPPLRPRPRPCPDSCTTRSRRTPPTSTGTSRALHLPHGGASVGRSATASRPVRAPAAAMARLVRVQTRIWSSSE